MIKTFALGSAVADLTATMIALSGHGADESARLAFLTTTSILASLWGLARILRPLADQPLPAVLTVEDVTAQNTPTQREPRA